MKRTSRTLAGMLALMLCAGMLSGCGDSQQQAADTRSMITVQDDAAAEDDQRGDLNGDGLQDVTDAQLLMRYYVSNTLSNKPLAWAELIGNAPKTDPKEKDKQAAEKTMKNFLDATVEGDAAKVFQYSGMGDMLRMMSKSTKTDEELINDPNFTINKIESYTMGEAVEAPEALAEYQKAYEEGTAKARAVFANSNSAASELRMAYMTLSLLKPATKLYQCNVSMTNEGKINTSDLMIVCDDRGEWRVDLGVNAALSNYTEKANRTSLNTSASGLSKAVNSAVIDLDEKENGILPLLEGDYTWTGAEIASAESVTYDSTLITRDTAEALLKKQVQNYFEKAADLEYVSFRVKDGICTAAAIQMKLSTGSEIGVYPQTDIPAGTSVTDAMLMAAEKHS